MVNTVLLLAEPPALDTRINPVAAPAGTVTVIWVRAAFTVAPGAAVPLKLTVGLAPKFVPLIVTTLPAGPLAGVKEVITGGVPLVAVTVPNTERSASTLFATSKT